MDKKLPTGFLAFSISLFIAVLSSLIGLGGAELRLPFLIKLFKLSPLQAVITNKAISLVVVSSSFFSRLGVVHFYDLQENIYIAINLLSGSLIGAWVAADWATKVHSRTLQKVMAFLLVLIAFSLTLERYGAFHIHLSGVLLCLAGMLSGFFIGVVAALMGVAGGELLIPTIILLYPTDIKLAGSISLLISLPTMLSAFGRYSKDRSFNVLKERKALLFFMVLGSLMGSFLGGHMLLKWAPQDFILMLLIILLFLSAYKVWKH